MSLPEPGSHLSGGCNLVVTKERIQKVEHDAQSTGKTYTGADSRGQQADRFCDVSHRSDLFCERHHQAVVFHLTRLPKSVSRFVED
jgi:hypothetical protein